MLAYTERISNFEAAHVIETFALHVASQVCTRVYGQLTLDKRTLNGRVGNADEAQRSN
jgi:hypothetical protein